MTTFDMTDVRLRLDDQLCFALYAATNAVTRSYRPKLEKIGLTYPQYLVMIALWQSGEHSVRQLADRLGLGANAVTPLVDRLETSGLVTRRRDDHDRRVVHVELTEAGRALERLAAEAQRTVICETLMDDDRLEEIRAHLHALVANMEHAADTPGVDG